MRKEKHNLGSPLAPIARIGMAMYQQRAPQEFRWVASNQCLVTPMAPLVRECVSNQEAIPFLTIELNSYSLRNAEMLIMQRCINDNPECTYDELAKLLGVSVRTVYRMVKNSGGVPVKRTLGKKRGKHAKNYYASLYE